MNLFLPWARFAAAVVARTADDTARGGEGVPCFALAAALFPPWLGVGPSMMERNRRRFCPFRAPPSLMMDDDVDHTRTISRPFFSLFSCSFFFLQFCTYNNCWKWVNIWFIVWACLGKSPRFLRFSSELCTMHAFCFLFLFPPPPPPNQLISKNRILDMFSAPACLLHLLLYGLL